MDHASNCRAIYWLPIVYSLAMKTSTKSGHTESARFIEAAKATGADQAAFERAFKKIVKPKAAKAKRTKWRNRDGGHAPLIRQ